MRNTKHIGTGSRASICHWELEFKFKTKEQCATFIMRYLDDPVCGEFSFWRDDDDFYVNLSNPWAANLQDAAAILRDVDYSEDEPHRNLPTASDLQALMRQNNELIERIAALEEARAAIAKAEAAP